MSSNVCICTCICMCTHTHTYLRSYMLYIHMYVCMCVCMYICIVCMYMYDTLRLYSYTYTHKHTHTHTHIHKCIHLYISYTYIGVMLYYYRSSCYPVLTTISAVRLSYQLSAPHTFHSHTHTHARTHTHAHPPTSTTPRTSHPPILTPTQPPHTCANASLVVGRVIAYSPGQHLRHQLPVLHPLPCHQEKKKLSGIALTCTAYKQ